MGQTSIVAITLFIFSALGWYSYCDYQSIKNVEQARDALAKGYPRVSNELTKGLRTKVKYSSDECDLLLAIDGRLKDSKSLFLTAEKCLFGGGIENPNPYLAISLAFEIEDDMESARRVLVNTFEKVKYHESFFYRLANMSMSDGKKDEAKKLIVNLINRNAKNEQIILRSIQFFTKKNEWITAYSLITNLENLKNLSFESVITIYGVSKKNNDDKRSKKYIESINKVLNTLPQEKANIILTQLRKL